MRLDLSFLVLALYSTSALTLAVPVAEANNNAGLSPLLEVSFSFPPKRVFLSAHPPLQLLTHSPSSQTRQIEERGIFKKIGKALGRLKGGSKWPELKAKLNAPNPNPQPHVPFSGPVINGRIKGNNGKWVKYVPGMENQ